MLTGSAIDLGFAPKSSGQPDARAYQVIRSFPHLPAVIDGSQMQDAVPTLAVLAAFNTTPVRFTNIANLRVKECDRLAALAAELSRIAPGLGREDGDDLVVTADPALLADTADTHRDLCRPPHRDEFCACRAAVGRHRDSWTPVASAKPTPAIGLTLQD